MKGNSRNLFLEWKRTHPSPGRLTQPSGFRRRVTHAGSGADATEVTPPTPQKIHQPGNLQSELHHHLGPLKLTGIPSLGCRRDGHFNFFLANLILYKKNRLVSLCLSIYIINSIKISCFPPLLPAEKDSFLRQECRVQETWLEGNCYVSDKSRSCRWPCLFLSLSANLLTSQVPSRLSEWHLSVGLGKIILFSRYRNVWSSTKIPNRISSPKSDWKTSFPYAYYFA